MFVKALDMLQGDTNMYLGYLLPTIEVLKSKLEDLKPSLEVCGPLADALIHGLKKRFGHLLSDEFHLLSTISHPKFKDMEYFDEEIKIRAKELFVRELSKVIPKQSTESNESTENIDNSDESDGFFSRKKKPKLQESPYEMADRYIRTEGLTDSEIITAFSYVKVVFEKFNTTLPSSASVERLFSQAGLIFGKKRQLLSDTNFEAKLMLKLNKSFYTN